MLKNYLLIAYKVLMRRKFFTFISLFGISFTLMILVVSVAFLDHSFTPQKPESKFDRALWMPRWRMRSPDKNSNWNASGGFYTMDKYLRRIVSRTNGAVEAFAIFTNTAPVTTYLNNEKIEFQLRRTEAAYWNIVDMTFLEGAPFTEQDDLEKNFVVVINETMRRKFFNGEQALGKDIVFDGRQYRVVGVVKDVPEARRVAFADIWAPIGTDKRNVRVASITKNDDLMGYFECVLLARHPDDFDAIRDAVRQSLTDVVFPNPKEFNLIETMPHNYFSLVANQIFFDWETIYSEYQSPKLVAAILFCFACFMFLPSINLINLNVSRIMERASEIGVRKAFGASSRVLVLQFLIENLVLTCIGGVLGLVFSALALKWMNEIGIWQYADFTLNWRVFLLGFVLMLIFGVVSGVYPAWRMSRLNPIDALKGVAR
ncbi:MAG: FtsX-like permease family protein [Chloroherpetonaceae bacterium]